ncbi:MAG TPA: hypothetical protein VNU47_00480 [Candidatus Paceibacterota bacterium]|nr:hypothetical protein [Candidatus Paceibacterota bacterium]
MAESDSPLERLRKRLYMPGGKTPTPVPSYSAPASMSTPGGWAPDPEPPKPRISFSAYFLIGAAGFFVIASVLAVLFLFFGTRSVSTDRVDVTIKGPTSIASGDKVSLIVSVENRNPAPIASTLLTLDFPDGTYVPETQSEPMVRYSDTVGEVMPGERVNRTVAAVISGSANQVVTIPVTFEYRIDGSNAVFVKKEQYSFTITSSPVSLAVASLAESASGQPITVTATLRSNGIDPVENLAVLATYPPGFTVQSTEPAPSAGNLFMLGALAPGESRTIKVTGVLTGQQNDERVFKFTAGTPRGGGSQSLAVMYTTQESTVLITRPFLAVALALNRSESEEVVVRAGSSVSGSISWVNTLPTAILDGEIRVKVSGNAFDPRGVSTSNGFYRSSDTTIVFAGDRIPSLRRLEPGDNGSASFSIPLIEDSSLRQPTVTLDVSVSGKRVGETGAQETVTSTLTRKILVSTDLSLTSRVVRTIGPFTNTGPWPPVEDQTTTYTILMAASNTVNSVGGARVTTTLPSYVTFTGKVHPDDGSITYNAATREVSWAVGDMPAGTTGKQGAFQVSLLPSASQRGTSPILVFPQTITGTDRFLQKQVTGSAPDLTTKTPTDPGYNPAYGNVVK